MKKLYTFLVLIAACLMLSSCNKKDKNNGGNGGSNYSDSQFVGSYMMWESGNEMLDRIYDIADSYNALCYERDTYYSQGNWEKAREIQEEIDMLLEEQFLSYADVVDISNGKFRDATALLYFNCKSSNNVYKKYDCNWNGYANMHFTVSFVIDNWNVRQYSVGDGGSYLIAGDDYVYSTDNNGIIWWDYKYFPVGDWFKNFR